MKKAVIWGKPGLEGQAEGKGKSWVMRQAMTVSLDGEQGGDRRSAFRLRQYMMHPAHHPLER